MTEKKNKSTEFSASTAGHRLQYLKERNEAAAAGKGFPTQSMWFKALQEKAKVKKGQ